MGPALSFLARLKGLRGTVFDPFGRTAERRMERQLVADYEALVESVLAALTPANHAAAVALLGLAGMVRGYGPVKLASVEAYRAVLPAAQAAFASGSKAAAA